MSKEYILSIDPSNKASAYCVIELPTLKPIEVGFLPEEEMLNFVEDFVCASDKIVYLAVEGLQNLGQVVGQDVFNTAYLVGKILERAILVPRLRCETEDVCDVHGTKLLELTTAAPRYEDIKIILRNQEKKTICGKVVKIKDKDIKNALIKRFAPNVPNNGKGSKKEQGWFYGFKADIWQSYAIGITYYELYYKK